MKKKSDTVIDRKFWDKGVWDTEPDWAQFEYKGYQTEQGRNENRGVWCGYITIPLEEAIKIGIDTNASRYDTYSALSKKIEVHGDFTYCGITIDGKIIVGFDCGHASDFCPGDAVHYSKMRSIAEASQDESAKKLVESMDRFNHIRLAWDDDLTYKTLEFAQNECRSAIDQLEVLLNKE